MNIDLSGDMLTDSGYIGLPGPWWRRDDLIIDSDPDDWPEWLSKGPVFD